MLVFVYLFPWTFDNSFVTNRTMNKLFINVCFWVGLKWQNCKCNIYSGSTAHLQYLFLRDGKQPSCFKGLRCYCFLWCNWPLMLSLHSVDILWQFLLLLWPQMPQKTGLIWWVCICVQTRQSTRTAALQNSHEWPAIYLFEDLTQRTPYTYTRNK